MLSPGETQDIWARLAERHGLTIVEACAVCGSRDMRAIAVFHDRMCLNRCLGCGLVLMGPRGPGNSYQPGFVETYYLPTAKRRGMLTEDETPVLDVIYGRYRKIADLTAGLNPAGPVADIGCGIGLSMLAMKHLSIASVGYDITGEFVDQARAFGLDAQCRDIVSRPVLAERFAVVTLSSMIEHLPDPVGFLRDIRRNVLRPGGHIVITTPNILSVDFIRDGDAITNINDDHFWFFTDATLSLALRNAGYEIVTVYQENRRFRDPVLENARIYLQGFLGLDANLSGGIGIVARNRL